MAFCEELARRSNRVRLTHLGISGEGRKLPLLVLAEPPVATPAEAAHSGKLLVLAIGNIHAGEVDGKEALLMLARDLALAKDATLLKHLIVAICPIFNADGNEPISRSHRTDQAGPEEGVGNRENAAGYDLNRDFVKLETPEDRALVRFFNEWDPAIFIDAHTTNGSAHRYKLTYDGPRHPAVPAAIIEAVRDRLLPDAGRRMEKATGYQSFFYGNFTPDRVAWETYPAEPRYGVQYFGLRGRLSILTESYSYAPFRERVRANYAFIQGCLEAAAARRDEIQALLRPAKPIQSIAIRTKEVPLKGPWKVLGYVEEERDGKRVSTDQPKDYQLAYLGKSEARLSVSRPFAYLLPASLKSAVDTLRRHGVILEELNAESLLPVEIYRIDKVSRSASPFQKHRLITVNATARKESRKVPAGTLVVRTDQPLGTLAIVLLEPQCDDGLTTWNFFDAGLAEGADFPVLRLPKETPLSVTPIHDRR
jgi:hypothetical protein